MVTLGEAAIREGGQKRPVRLMYSPSHIRIFPDSALVYPAGVTLKALELQDLRQRTFATSTSAAEVKKDIFRQNKWTISAGNRPYFLWYM